MFQAFVIVLREGFESFLIISLIVSYLKKVGRDFLLPPVYWGVVVSFIASVAMGFFLAKGANEPLWEGVLGLIAAVMVTTLVVHMWIEAPHIKRDMEKKIDTIASGQSRKWMAIGIFIFTVFMIAREGMEAALLLIQVPQANIFAGAFFGLLAAALFAVLWVRFSSLINVKLFFQVTGIFLLLFVVQILIYSFHELSEAGILPNSEAFHLATEPFSPDGIYGKWFSIITILVCAGWLLSAWFQNKFIGVPAGKK